MNQFCLIVTFETGESTYLTDTPDLMEALKRLSKVLEAGRTYKSDVIHNIIGARLVRINGCLNQ